MLLREEKRIKNEKSSYFILNIEYITISHYFKIIKIYNDDSIKESDWIFIFSENDKIIHLKRLTEAKTEYKTTNELWTNKVKTIEIYYTNYWSRIKKKCIMLLVLNVQIR